MSSITPNNNDQEIDLRQVSQKMGQAYESFLSWIFSGVLFVKRNLIVLIVLFILGAGIGYYLDKNSKVYDHEVIVSPNFGSGDYLYSKINLLKAKLNEGDTSFFNNLGIKASAKFSGIEIKPIVDVYKFIDNKPENFELIKLMAENGDVNKIIDEKITSKNYPYHRIIYTTNAITNENNSLVPLMNFLNDGEYYKKIQKKHLENLVDRLKTNDSIITQIDRVLNSYSSNSSFGSKSDKLVYFNENTQLSEIFKAKADLIKDQEAIQMEFLNVDSIIKKNSSVLNIKNTESVNGKMKLVVPLLFILGFFFICLLKNLYVYQLKKSKN